MSTKSFTNSRLSANGAARVLISHPSESLHGPAIRPAKPKEAFGVSKRMIQCAALVALCAGACARESKKPDAINESPDKNQTPLKTTDGPKPESKTENGSKDYSPAALRKGPSYPAIATFPTLVDARHANTEAVDLFNRFFAAKSRRDCNATMEFISRDLSVYVDATLGWELNGYDALKAVWAQYMPTWGEGRSYPTRILGEVNGGTGSVMLEFTDTPELFGGEMRIWGAVDVVDGKITRWADYFDSAAFDGKRFEKAKRTIVDPPHALRSKSAATSARIREVSSKFVEMLSGGDTEGAAALFSYDGVFEDSSLNTKIAGSPAIKRYLARVNDKSPFGRGVKLGHVVGGNAGGGFEWASSSSPVKTGAAALSINAEGKITRACIVYDSRNLSATSRNELAALALEPLQ